jgi:hypothetical protein
VTVTAKQTMKNMDEGKNEVVSLDYEEMKKYIEEHKKTLFGNAKRIQINVFTEKGWRAGYKFNNNEDIDWFSVTRIDGYKQSREIDTIYAVQILLF